LAPGPDGSWDDHTTWTGSVIGHDGRWYLLYTGTSSAEQGLVQRIGLAVSDDLTRWERIGGSPLIEADPRWYETLDSGQWHDQAWRDPWVLRHHDGAFHATITARVNHGPRDCRGVLAHARSADLLEWEVLPPLTVPDGFGEVEVSQLISYGDSWYMVFCSDMRTQADHRRRTGAGTGTYYLRSAEAFGSYPLGDARPLRADRHGSTYAGRLVDRGTQGLFFLSWSRNGPRSSFVGAISDPVPVEVSAAGDLQLADPS
jgi:beta-fructofuranosidase